jgi:hypothetical protein
VSDHTIPYISPARAAVAARLRAGGAITPEQITTLANISDAQGKAYLSNLASKRVLVRNDDGSFRAGPLAATWRSHIPFTRPGGNSKQYRTARRLRDKLDAENGYQKPVRLTCQEVTGPAKPGHNLGLLTLGGGNAGGSGQSAGDGRIPPHMGVGEIVAALGCSERTVWRRITDGTLAGAFKFGGQWCVPVASVQELMARGR